MIVSCEKSDTNDLETYDASQKTETVISSDEGEEKEITLDYHEKYGVVKANEYPMDSAGFQKPTIDAFLEKGNIKKEEVAKYKITKERFSGVGLAEHRMEDGNVIEVAHRFENESVYKAEFEMVDGQMKYVIIIIVCSNGLVIIIIL